MRVHWGRAPGKVAILTIVDNGNDNHYGYGSGHDTGHDNGNNVYNIMKIIMAMAMTIPGLTSCRLEQDLRPPPLCNCDLARIYNCGDDKTDDNDNDDKTGE